MSRFSNNSDQLGEVIAKRTSAGGRMPPIVPPKLLEAIEQNAREHFARLLNGMFDTTDDLFYDLSSRASSNNEANLYFESMREIRVQKEGVITRALQGFTDGFIMMLEGALLNEKDGEKGSDELDRSDLSLVQSDDLEIDLAYTNMVGSAKALHKQELHDLAARLDHLLIQLRVDDENNPLHPSYICLCFLDACKDVLSINIKTRLILFKQFEKHVLKQLGHMYAEANQMLREAGILPKVPRNLGRKGSADSGSAYGANDTAAPQDSYADTGENAADAINNTAQGIDLSQATNLPPGAKAYILTQPSQQSGFEMSKTELRMMLAKLRQVAPAPVSTGIASSPTINLSLGNIAAPSNYAVYTSNPGPQMAADDLLRYLTQSQTSVDQNLAQTSPVNVIGNVVQDALSEKSPEAPHSLDQNNEDIINLVALFFDQVIAEKDIPSVIQSAICRLQIPILKVALKDKDFFSNYHHPARSFVNAITDLGIGFDENKPVSKDPLYKKIVSVIEYINENYDDNIDIFTEQQSVLQTAVQKEQRKAEVVEQRTKQAESGKMQLQLAKSESQDAIYKKIKDIQLPKEINRFLSSSWLQVMMIVHLRHGTESNEWVAMEQVITDLIWLCQLHEDRRSQMRRERIFPVLLDQIQDALATAIDNEDTRRNLVNNLENTIRKIIENQVSEESFEDLQPEQKEELGRGEQDQKRWDEMTAVEKQQMRYDELSKHFFDAAKNLKEGDWLEFKEQESNKILRCKLSAIVDNDNYIFVNRMGFKAYTKSRKELAYDMQFKRANIVDNSPLFDRMMQKVVSSLSTPESA